MDKNAIKKYAVWAREELIKRVSARAEKYGISKDNMVAGTAETVNGILLTSSERAQRTKLIEQIKTKGYEQVMEEVAYTWFNRFCALRFMEVNNYLPTHIRVFTDENNKFEPQIMAEAIHLELEGLDKSKVLDLKEKNANDELYKYLLITQCNALSSILPGMFQKISDYTELLFPDNILRDGSVIEQMVTCIDEEDFNGDVQIIGWMYQYYVTSLNELVYDGNMSKQKVPKNLLSPATTLYTPDWAVRYMVENSLGRLWYESHPDDALKSNWKYYLDEAEQEAEVQAQLNKIREEYKLLKPEDIKCIDPCMGSGHILVYMFDVLMQIYESYGYNARDAAASIVEKNLYGLDIDDRAAQLAYFAVMMKARQYDRRFFSRGIKPHIYAIPDYEDWKEYGSLTIIDEMPQRPKNNGDQMTLSDLNNDFLNSVVDVAEMLTKKYDVVVTNPPYLGSSRFSPKLADYVSKNYPNEKSDLSSAFYRKSLDEYLKQGGYVGFITTSSWFFLKSFEKLREYVVQNFQIENIADFGTELFDGKVGHNPIVSWVTRKIGPYKNIKAVRLVDYCYSRRDEKEPEFFNVRNHFTANQKNFSKIPGSPIAYWVSEKFIKAYQNGRLIGQFSMVSEGIKTGDNNRFLRLWFEISSNKFSFANIKDGVKWYPHHKGGEFRKWYGNRDWIINWNENGAEIKPSVNSGLQGKTMYFSKFASWSKISSKGNPFRVYENNFLFDSGAPAVSNQELLLTVALFNSNVGAYYLTVISPTLNLQVGDVKNVPLVTKQSSEIEDIVIRNIDLSKTDWDSFETSWDFKKHPLARSGSIQSAFEAWEQECTTRFTQLKANEEELNRIFIDIYGLQDELTPEVADKDVTVRLADKTRDMKSFISYAVGCMFGRYSHYTEGLFYAGGHWDYGSKVELITDFARENGFSPWNPSSLFLPDRDNILPICDDEYFDDDIVGRFVSFVETVYGKETLEENLKFIADAIGGKGQPKEVLRNYFLNDFFADHCKIYQKRPIYWLFDSGKKNGFKALIYMHRYQPDTLARMRTDYVHEQQGRYRTAINDLQHRINDATTAERVKLTKQLAKIQDQDTELRIYEEKIHHLADKMEPIDLDDGVKHNYELFQDVLAKIK